jgi:N-formylglutamate deformylase
LATAIQRPAIAGKAFMPQPNGLVDGPLTPQGLPAYLLRRGNSGLLVSMPHVGTTIPPDIAARMTPAALQVADTDWHLPLVYDLEGLDATILVATHSRLVIDLNRPPDDASLYPGRDTTGLIPVDTFRKEPVYRGEVPDEAETASRRRNYWLPYHQALDAELARLREQHTRVVLWEAHSIASELPRFFSGRLTDLNFGTADGASCAPELVSESWPRCRNSSVTRGCSTAASRVDTSRAGSANRPGGCMRCNSR